MVTILFSIYDERTDTGFRVIEHKEPSLKLCKDYMHQYHNRSSGWYRYMEDGIRYAAYDKTGVI